MTDQWKLLLVDDEQDIREVTSLVIKDQGFEVYTAEDGVSGFEMVKSAAPQIVVTDVKMPRMGGIELLRKVKERIEDIEVIVITAFGEMNLAIEALQLDASDFINKPIDDAAFRISEIVSSLLTFSRKSEAAFTRVDVKRLLEKCALLCQHKLELSSIELAMEIDPDLKPIHADFNQIQQSIINLVFNAVDAIGTGGKITISAMNKVEEGQVWIEVRDNGKGIDPEELNRIFEPFYTTKDEGYGVGLGLSIIFGIMERHGGSIEADSKPGRGTSFTLRFPFRGEKQ